MPPVPESTAPLQPGEMLDDKYRIDCLLSVGGMGAVYRGTHLLLKKPVAIKALRRDRVGAAAMMERFRREAEAASAIGHENIVTITDMGKTGAGVAFLVMEYLEGRSLEDAIQADGPFSIETACEVACEILAGVAAAHGAGIVHRDLKPANVFLARRSSGREVVKLLDFGIAILDDGNDPDTRLTQTGMILGTPQYMAPEQARGEKELSDAVDIYAVGVILYEMLCKRIPYQAENYNMLIYQVATGQYDRPSVHRPELPPALEAIILKAMARDPWDRFGSAEDIIDALAPFCAGRVSATPSVRIPTQETIQGRPRVHKRSATAISDTLAAPSRGSQPDAEAATVARRAPGSASESAPDTASGHTGATGTTDTGSIGAGSIGAGSIGAGSIGAGSIGAELAAVRRSWLRVAVPAVAVVLAAILAVALWPDGARGPGTRVPAVPRARPAATPPTPPTPSTSATPAAAAQVQAHAPASAVPADVVLELAVTPPDAVVTVDGRPVSGGSVALPAGTAPLSVRIEAAGHEPYEGQIVPDRSQRLAVSLVPSAAPVAGPGERARPARPARPDRARARRERAPASTDRAGSGSDRGLVRPRRSGSNRIITDDPYGSN